MFGDILTTILPVLGYETIGLDVKCVPLKYPAFKSVQGDIRSTRFPNNWFDAVVMVSTLEHIGVWNGDVAGDKKAVEEIGRILKDNEIMIVTIPCVKKNIIRYDKQTHFYDYQTLLELFHSFRIENFEILKRDKDGFWIPTSKDDVPDYKGSVEAVALVTARRNPRAKVE